MRMNGDTGARHDRFTIGVDDFFQLPVTVPPTRDEQYAIGRFFDDIDASLQAQQTRLTQLRHLKQTMLTKMFPRDGETKSEIRLEGFDGEWNEATVGNLSTINNGRDYKHLSPGNIPVYGTGGYMTSVDEALATNDDAIGIGRKGTIDNPYILKAPFWTVDTLFYVVPNSDVDLQFLYGAFQCIDWGSKNQATGLPSLTQKAISAAGVRTPPTLDEQRAIGTYFTKLDQLIELEDSKLTKLQQLKTAFLDKMFV